MFDECGALKPELVEYTVFEVIGPRVHVIGLGGTPGRDRRKLFYEATRPGSDKHRPYRDRAKYPDFNGYSSHSWDLEDIIALPNAKKLYAELCRLWAEALIEKRDNKWSDDNPIWLREYKKTWAADGHAPRLRIVRAASRWQAVERLGPLRRQRPDRRRRRPPHRDREAKEAAPGVHRLALCRSQGQGHKDPFACNPLAFSPHDPQRRKWQVMSFERMGMGYGKPIAQLLIGEAEVDAFVKTDVFPTKFGGVFGELGGWPDGMIIDSDNALLEDLKNVYGIKTEKADKKPDYKKGAIELVNGEFTDGRLIVLLGSPMQEQLEQLQWKEQDNGTLIEDPAQANHSTDTAVYGCQLIATMFSSGLVAQDSKPAAAELPGSYGTRARDRHVEQPDDEQALLAPSEWSEDDEDW
jgi:hypothetical protein